MKKICKHFIQSVTVYYIMHATTSTEAEKNAPKISISWSKFTIVEL